MISVVVLSEDKNLGKFLKDVSHIVHLNLGIDICSQLSAIRRDNYYLNTFEIICRLSG